MAEPFLNFSDIRTVPNSAPVADLVRSAFQESTFSLRAQLLDLLALLPWRRFCR